MTKINFNVTDDILKPVRATQYSAGYDFRAKEDVTIPPLLMFNKKRNFIAETPKEDLQDNNKQFADLIHTLSEKGLGNYQDIADVGEDTILGILDGDEDNDKLISVFERYFEMLSEYIKPTLVYTGVKVTMPNDVTLLMYNRSSNPLKRSLVLANGTGVVDADYPGEIAFAFYNLSDQPVTIRRGERIGQGVFTHYLLTEDDNASGKRTGGMGSTGIK